MQINYSFEYSGTAPDLEFTYTPFVGASDRAVFMPNRNRFTIFLLLFLSVLLILSSSAFANLSRMSIYFNNYSTLTRNPRQVGADSACLPDIWMDNSGHITRALQRFYITTSFLVITDFPVISIFMV